MLANFNNNGGASPHNKKEKTMTKKINDPFGFTKAINFQKLNDPKVLKELEKIFTKEEAVNETVVQSDIKEARRSELRKAHDLKGTKKLW